MTDTANSTRWVSPRTAMAYFDLSRSTIYRLIEQGVLPVRRFPGRRSFLINLDEAESNLTEAN